MGTREGLNLYNPKNDHLQVVPLSQNDSRVFITGIVEDDNKNMWVTTANGVVNVIPSIDTKTEIILSTITGMMIRTVCRAVSSNQRSIKRLSSGEIAMGGMYGLNTFRRREYQI